ncbi:MAG: HupE/UreJ family protein [Pseudanabaenaceae cyanobacterium]
MTNWQQRLGQVAVIALPWVFIPVAIAHTGHGETVGFDHGFLHPFGGPDHVLAMVAVGLWAGQLGDRALGLVPVGFLGAMALAAGGGMVGGPFPLMESGIVLSVLVGGLLVALAVRLPATTGMAIAGLLAITHGWAHGAEMPADGDGLTYGLGFVAATTLLLLSGIGLASICQRWEQPKSLRALGALVALSSLYLWFA